MAFAELFGKAIWRRIRLKNFNVNKLKKNIVCNPILTQVLNPAHYPQILELASNNIYHLETRRFNGGNVQTTTSNIYHLFKTSHL